LINQFFLITCFKLENKSKIIQQLPLIINVLY